MKTAGMISIFLWITAQAYVYGEEKSALLWIEAESSPRTNMSSDEQFKPKNAEEANKFSGGAWLNGTPADLPNAFAEYDIDVKKDGTYKLYVRRFYSHGPFRWRIDAGAWQNVETHPGTLQDQSIRKFVNATWIYPGDVQISAGKHTLRVELLYKEELAKSSKAFGFDCFVLAPEFFVPNGKYSPLEPVGLVDEGMWGFEAPTDPFTQSDLDLRYLNEEVAGMNGPITASGDDFILANGEKVRFWCANFHNHNLDYESMQYIARQYAKSGVNMVRLFWPIFSGKVETNDPYALDSHIQEGYYKAVAAFKAEGIYVKICTYFVLPAKLREAWGIKGYKDYLNRWYKPFAVIYFSERLKELYKVRNKELFTTQNPYTGLSLAEDPSVAIIQTQNEDGLFFSSFTGMFPMQEMTDQVRKQFADFLIEKYGSLEVAQEKWGVPKDISDKVFPYKRKGKDKKDRSNWIYDDPANGLMNISTSFNISTKSDTSRLIGFCFPPKERKSNADLIASLVPKVELRMKDSVEFLLQVQRNFNKEMIGFYKNDINSKALITSGNWKGSFCQAMQDRERYTYLDDDVVDRHIYQSPLHVNPPKSKKKTSSYQVNVGDLYADYTSLVRPWNNPINYKFLSGKPHIMSECNWSNPNFYQLEGPWLIAVFGARNGLDMFTWFNIFTPGYDIFTAKFPVATPNILGQFPANALLYRKGYVEEVKPVVHEDRSFADICDKVVPSCGESKGFDPTRDKEVTEGLSKTGYGNYPTAFLSGPVSWSVTDKTMLSVARELKDLQNDKEGEAWGLKKQTYWNWANGYATVDTEKAQGVVGFTQKSGTVALSECTIDMQHDFSSVMIVPLDDKPLAKSKKILVQIGVHARPYGWKEEPAEIVRGKGKEKKMIPGKRILSMGEGVYNIPLIHGSVTFAHPIKSATALDANGYPQLSSVVEITGATVTLPEDALYIIVRR